MGNDALTKFRWPRYRLNMGLADLTTAAVNSALDEYDALGGDAFRTKYGYEKAQDCFVVRGEKRYDSGAVAAAAHGYLPEGTPIGAAFDIGATSVNHQM